MVVQCVEDSPDLGAVLEPLLLHLTILHGFEYLKGKHFRYWGLGMLCRLDVKLRDGR